MSQATRQLSKDFDKNKDKASKMHRQLKVIGSYKRLQTQLMDNGGALAYMRETAKCLEQRLKYTKKQCSITG